MTDLADRLRAALDHAEAVARDAQTAGLDDEWPFWIDRDGDWEFEAAGAWRNQFKPAACLRTIAAHREIVEWCRSRLPYAAPVLRSLASIYPPDTDQGESR